MLISKFAVLYWAVIMPILMTWSPWVVGWTWLVLGGIVKEAKVPCVHP